MYTRREFGSLAFAGLAAPLAAARASSADAVRLGVRTSSFREVPVGPGRDPVDALIQSVIACGVSECELHAPQVEARFGAAHGEHHGVSSMSPQMMRRELRKWRLRTPISRYASIGDRFRKAGIVIGAYHYSPDRTFTDEEIDRGFAAARALGADLITASTTLDVAKRMAPFAERHRMVVAVHGQSCPTDSDGSLTPHAFTAAPNPSPFLKVALDIGCFTTANLDAVAFIEAHHATIASLYLKDRRRNHGDNVPGGEGDTPIRQVLTVLKRHGWPIRAYVESADAGQRGPIDEVKKCLAFARRALT